MVNFDWLHDWNGNEPVWTPDQYYENDAIDACVAAKNNFMESYIATKVEPESDGYIVDMDDVDWDNVDELVNNFREMAEADPERFIVTHEEQIYACSVYGVFYRYDHANNHDVFTLVWYD